MRWLPMSGWLHLSIAASPSLLHHAHGSSSFYFFAWTLWKAFGFWYVMAGLVSCGCLALCALGPFPLVPCFALVPCTETEETPCGRGWPICTLLTVVDWVGAGC
jgi:hypothetical protein